jgi:hypothetical protein
MGMKKDVKIVYHDEDVIVAEEGGETVIFYPYCGGCHSGFWYMEVEKLTRSVFDSLPIKIKEKLRMLNLEPD